MLPAQGWSFPLPVFLPASSLRRPLSGVPPPAGRRPPEEHPPPLPRVPALPDYALQIGPSPMPSGVPSGVLSPASSLRRPLSGVPPPPARATSPGRASAAAGYRASSCSAISARPCVRTTPPRRKILTAWDERPTTSTCARSCTSTKTIACSAASTRSRALWRA